MLSSLMLFGPNAASNFAGERGLSAGSGAGVAGRNGRVGPGGGDVSIPAPASTVTASSPAGATSGEVQPETTRTTIQKRSMVSWCPKTSDSWSPETNGD